MLSGVPNWNNCNQYIKKCYHTLSTFANNLIEITKAFTIQKQPTDLRCVPFDHIVFEIKWRHGTFLIRKLFQAFLNPLQALFNCLVYRRWAKGSERVVIPWQMVGNFPSTFNSVKSLSTTNEESVPLLENRARTSINGYSGSYQQS